VTFLYKKELYRKETNELKSKTFHPIKESYYKPCAERVHTA